MHKTETETKAMLLLKPLFVDGMFNRSGKRSRFIKAGSLGEYTLYKGGNDFNVDYNIYTEINGYLVYISTAEELEAYSKERLIVILENYLKRCESAYLCSKEDPDVWPDFIGACLAGELEQALKLSETFKAKQVQKEKLESIEREKQEQIEKEKERQAFAERISKVKEQFKGLGKIDDIDAVIALAERLGVNIPLRTKGWMMESLAEITLRPEDDPNGDIGYRYHRKTKNSKGSQAVFTVIENIRDAVIWELR